MRARVTPQASRTIQFIGDMHFGYGSFPMVRFDKIVADLTNSTRMVPTPAARIQVGDLTEAGTVTQSATGKAWMDALPGDAPWYGVVGNHDLWNDRFGDTLAQEWGMPAANYTVDLGFCVVVILGPIGTDTPDRTTVVIEQETLDWLDATLTSLVGRDVIVVAHAPLYNTVVGLDAENFRSNSAGFYIVAPTYAQRDDGTRDAALRAVMDDHPHIRCYIAGHTHSDFRATGLTTTVDLGSHTIGSINCGAPIYISKDKTTLRWHPIRTPFVTVLPDSIEVRWRNHGAGVWEGPAGQRVTSLAA